MRSTSVSGRWLGLLAVTIALVVSAVTAPSVGATPTPSAVRYVSLGDSYAAASGVLPTDAARPPICFVSTRGYAKLIAARFGYRHTDVSCAGASTESMFSSQFPGVRRQLDALDHTTSLVTMVIGGNDGNVFMRIIGSCVALAAARPGVFSPCRDVNGSSFVEEVRRETFPKLLATFRAVRAKAPTARVAALNYPWIAPAAPTACAGLGLAPGDVVYSHEIEAALDDEIERAARLTGVEYVDVASRSVGHDACRPPAQRWVESLVPSGDPTPVHPNARGASEMARITAQVLGLS